MSKNAMITKLYCENTRSFETNAYIIHEPSGLKRLFSCGVEVARVTSSGVPYKVTVVDRLTVWNHLRTFTSSYAPEWHTKVGETLDSYKRAWAKVLYMFC